MSRLRATITHATVAVVLGLSAVLAGPAHAHVTMTWGLWPGVPAVESTLNSLGSCDSRVRIWHKEHGISGITRLRAKFELRGRYDPGIPFLTYAASGWGRTNSFPDDWRSFSTGWSYTFRHLPGGTYSVRGILIGERPSFWQPDRKISTTIGEAYCSAFNQGGG